MISTIKQTSCLWVSAGEESVPEGHDPNQDRNLFRSLMDCTRIGPGPRGSSTFQGPAAGTNMSPSLAARAGGEAIALPGTAYCHKQKKVLAGQQASNSQACPSGDVSAMPSLEASAIQGDGSLEGSALQVDAGPVKPYPNSSKHRETDDEDVDICSDEEMDVEGADATNAAVLPPEPPAQNENTAADLAPPGTTEPSRRAEGINPLGPKASGIASQGMAESTGQGEGSVSIDVQGLPNELSLLLSEQELEEGPGEGTSTPGRTDLRIGSGNDVDGEVAAATLTAGLIGVSDAASGAQAGNKNGKGKGKAGPQPPKKPRSAYILFSGDYRCASA